ncbi:hypothetical protein CWE13_07780 [Aliidiomarina shirensis]|uniref:diguanylate cyclase n=1 Tax=Aliidiomarina shirensis TaxID=1048642 RepID=A0A432WSJ4_9GAMM|nr:GGDEF domain-containing protein [Aliidiomarina shirensis]RUO36740.1 hypothetical protein CWE13_07780 [Aliidiomarina shirensis]
MNKRKTSGFGYRAILVVNLFLFLIFVAVQAAWAQDIERITHPELEERLDSYLSIDDVEAAAVELDDILGSLDPDQYPSTYVRGRTYKAFELAERGDIPGAIELIEDMQSFTERYPYPDVIAEVQANLVALNWYNGEVARSLILAEQLIEELEDTQNPRILYYANSIMVGIFRANSQYERALERAIQALDAIQGSDNPRTELRRVSLTREITGIHSDLRNFDEALALAKRNVEEAKRIELVEDVPDLLLLQGFIEGQMELYEDSMATYEEAIEWASRVGFEDTVLLSMNNIGSTLIELERYEEAKEMLTEALNYIDVESADDDSMAHLLRFNLGYIDVFLGNIESGIAQVVENGDRLLALYSALEQADLYDYIARAYARAGMFEQQGEALIAQRDLRADIFRSDREASLSELQSRYDAQDQLQQIELLEQRNALQERVIENKQLQQQIVVLFAIVVILGLVLVGIMYRAARRANKQLKVANKQLEFHSQRDPLTALFNRRALQEKMQKREQGERRAHLAEYPDAMILLDIDYFKRINDNFGHAAGDTVLKELSTRLLSIVRSSDLVIRWGGEEFLIYLQNMNPEKLSDYAEKVLTVIGSKAVVHEGKKIQVTATAGFISLPFAGVDESNIGWEKTLQIADMALYIGKVHGRNRAYGITGLKAPYEEVSRYLDNDLAEAMEKDLIHYELITGPNVGKQNMN